MFKVYVVTPDGSAEDSHYFEKKAAERRKQWIYDTKVTNPNNAIAHVYIVEEK